MIKHILATLPLLALGITTATAGTAPTGWYLGLGVGGAAVDLDDAESDLRSDGWLIREKEDSGGALRMYLGYQVNSIIAVETGFVRFGEFELEVRDPGSTRDGFREEWEGSAVYLDAVAGIDLTQSWRVFARLGLARSRMESQLYEVIDREPFRRSRETANSTDLKFGLGLEYTFTRWGLRLDVESYRNVGDDGSTGEADVGLATLSAQYRF
ncbi:MAG: outer membrane beta-barrel protein [Ectothiorhodospiraceae bacterium]|nr:outer membrane beta-barrel protein [Ectothiorhodospiraceae bacterium]